MYESNAAFSPEFGRIESGVGRALNPRESN